MKNRNRTLTRNNYFRLVLIIRAFDSIFAPMSPILFPLMSILDRLTLLARLLMRMVVPVFNLESHTERDSNGWREKETQPL